MSDHDASTDVRAIRTVLESILKRCDLPAFDPSKHESLVSLRAEIERAHTLIVEVNDAIRNAIRVDVSEAEESVGKLERSRDRYREQAEDLESTLDARLSTAHDLASAVTEFIGHISVDESLSVHRIRMLAHDVKEAA